MAQDSRREEPAYGSANVPDFLLADKPPTRVALHAIHETYSYGALQCSVAAVARHLAEHGFRKGDRLLLLSDNSFFWVAAYLGTLKAGLVCVPLPPTTSPRDLAYVLNITEARLAFAPTTVAAKHRACLSGIPVITDTEALHTWRALSAQTPRGLVASVPSNDSPLPEVRPHDLAALMFTSGSTGRPRGVMVSHANIMANSESIVRYLGLTANDRMMTVLPFHYCFGTSLLHTHLRVGASLVIESHFAYVEAMLQRMLDTRCTGFAGVPSHFQILLRNSSLRKKGFPHLRHLQQAGGHLASTHIRELQEALPQTRIYVMYGQTEATSRLSYLPPELLDRKLGSIGKGIPGVTLRVLNEAGDPVSPGEIGEVVAEGRNIAQGYWRAPADSAITFRHGLLYTGDLATVDPEGFIYIAGRAKDFVKCGGKRVGCRELEDTLLEFDELLEAAVVGVPDDIMGEAVKAFVVSRADDSSGLSARLHRFCRERLPRELVPHEIVILDALPKNSAGKVLKENLKAL